MKRSKRSHETGVASRRQLIHKIGAAAFCDNGAQISRTAIALALDVDRGAGFQDPTPDEVMLLVQGGEDGKPPPKLCAVHPALEALLTREMT